MLDGLDDRRCFFRFARLLQSSCCLNFIYAGALDANLNSCCGDSARPLFLAAASIEESGGTICYTTGGQLAR